MKLPERPISSRPDRWEKRIFFHVIAVALLSVALSPPVEARLYKIDLLRMAEQIDLRYYVAENGFLPPEYIFLGGLAVYPNFLQGEFDLNRISVEYDYVTGHIYRYSVPGEYGFSSREEREGAYFKRSERQMDFPGIRITLSSIESTAEEIRKREFRKIWTEEIRYNLEKDRETKRGGGLIDLSIPIKLPKQLEWFIGDGEKTRLRVSGREKITIGGTSRWCANCPVTEGRPEQKKFPDLDMEQQLTVSLNGNIGEKIIVKIDHSSMGGAMGSTNRISLRYEGLEDEIIKSIDMGDTDLTLSGAQLISYSGAAKGLFGIKVKAQIGLLGITLIASKEEGESASGSFSGTGGQSSRFVIADYNYIKRQYFYFETPGVSFETPVPGFIGHPLKYFPVYGGVNNDRAEVFISLKPYELQGGSLDVAKYKLRACVDPENDGITGSEEGAEEDWYRLLEENDDFGRGDYSLIQYISSATVTKYVGIRLNQPLDPERSLVIRYMSDMGTPETSDDIPIGDYNIFPPPSNPEQVLNAELIYPIEDEEDDLVPDANGHLGPYHSTWNMMMRNIYSLGTAGLDGGSLEVRIENVRTIIGTRDVQEETKLSYLRIFGLDQENKEGIRIPDGLIDDRKGILNFYYGYMMFPWYEPFNLSRDDIAYYLAMEVDENNNPIPDEEDYNQADSVMAHLELNNEIYTDYISNPKNEYNIVVEATSGSRTFQLNTFDIIEGTEVVTVDGERLSKGVGYDINYSSGVVTLKGDMLLTMSPDAKVSIDYQHKPMIGGGKSSLIGFSANMDLSTNSKLNASFLYNSVGSPRYNPRLGDEPTMNMAADINGSFQLSPDWMTSVANLLPRVDTDANSSLSINGEIAMSIPNPNRKGEAYIDDMEGIEDSRQLGLIRRMWYEASPPVDPFNPGQFLDPMSEETEFYWYNPVRQEESPQYKLTTSRRDLNPGLDMRENSSVSSVFIKAIAPEPGQWCGIMTGFPGGLDLTTAQYLEVWVNDYNTDPDERTGIIHFDFGKIDEDFHQPELDEINDEKEVDWTFKDDTGFPADTLVGNYPTEFKSSTWDPARRIYTGINSRKQNLYHDSEDLNRNGRLDERNEYYSLVLDLADTAIIDVQKDFSKDDYSSYWYDSDKTRGAGENYKINLKKSWRMYRLDLSKVKAPTGIAPRLDAIQHIRIWLENPSDLKARAEDDGSIDHMIEIAAMKFVGNRWEFDHIRDIEDETRIVSTPGMRVKIGSINNKDNPSIYNSPYNVQEEDGIEIREQSLSIDVEDFEKDRSFRLMKRFHGQGQNFQQYREIEFYVRGDYNLTSHDGDIVDFYLQLAYDSLNYYEIVVPLTTRMAGRWNSVHITLSDLTNMKLGAIAGVDTEAAVHDAVDPSKSYQAKLRGEPSLFNVRFLYAGLRNRTGVMIPHGQVWFNDLTLDNVRKDIDHAERMSFSANFANIFSVNGSWQRTGPEFRSLNQKRGSGMISNNYSISGKTDLNHLVPTARFQLPVTFRYGTNTSKPKYLPQKDVEIKDAAVQDSLRSVKNSYSFSLAMSRRGSQNFIMKNIFDNLKAGFNYSNNASFSPTSKDTSSTMSGNATYQLNFRKKRELNLFKGIKLKYWLTNFSFRANGARSIRTGYAFSGSEFVKRPTTYSCTWDNEMTSVYDPFESIKINYRRSEKRNLAVENMIYGVDVGILTHYRQSLDLSYQPKGNVFFISQFNPRFEYNTKYEEDLKPGVRQGDDPEGTRDVLASSDIGIVFDVDIGKYAIGFGKLVKLLGEEEEATARRLLSQRSSHQTRKAEFLDMMDKKMTTKQEKKPEGDIRLAPESPAPEKDTPGAQSGFPASGDKEKKGAFSDLGLGRPRRQLDSGSSSAAADTMAAVSVSADSIAVEKKAADPMLVFRHMLRFLGRVDPVKSSFNIDRRNRFERLHERAGMAYQYGFSSKSGTMGALGDADSNPLTETTQIVLDLRSGFDVTSKLSAKINFSASKRKEESDTRVTETENITWPDVNLNWRGLHEWPMLRKYIDNSDLTISYIQRTSKKQGGETTGYQLNPNWNLKWKNKLTSNISVSYSKKTTMERGQEMWEKNYSVNLELRYDIRGSKGFGVPLPFLKKKKLKFESTLTTVLNVTYNHSEKWNMPVITSFSVSPRFTYTFSKNVSGNLAINYRRSSGGIYGYINHEIGLHATAEFKF